MPFKIKRKFPETWCLETDPWRLVENLSCKILSHPNRRPTEKQVSGQGQEGFRETGGKNIPLRGDTLQELRSASWQLEQLLKWKKNVRYWRDAWQLLTIISGV